MNIIAKGNTAEIIEQDENQICKLFYPGYPKNYIEHEYNNANVVLSLGIRTPVAHKFISIGDRDGIVYDRVTGDTLSSKIYSNAKEEMMVWVNQFAEFHKELLSQHIDEVMDYKDFLKLFSGDSEEIIERINKLESDNCLLHGDFHPGNIMLNEDNQLVLIDMMNVCKGPAIYDVARTSFLLESNEKVQAEYLKLMEYDKKEIAPYLEVIQLIRENETKNAIRKAK